MNFKQLFCKHIWKQKSIDLLDAWTGYLFDSPISHNEKNAISYECIKCGKIKIVEQNFRRELTLDEIKNIMK